MSKYGMLKMHKIVDVSSVPGNALTPVSCLSPAGLPGIAHSHTCQWDCLVMLLPLLVEFPSNALVPLSRL